MSHAGMRALHYAAKSGSYEFLMFFFNLEIDIYLKDHSCQNFFYIVAAYRHLNLCKTLVEKHNFDVNIADNDGRVALHHSAKSGGFDLVTFFANKENNIHFKDSLGRICLHIAALSGHFTLYRTLINKHNFNAHMTDNDEWTALHYSARNRSCDLVTYFAEVGIDIYIKSSLGQNCLHIAALYGDMILCRTLIDKHNFDMHTVDNNGWTALHYSARNGSYELVSFFVDMRTDILVKDNLGRNCLHIAAPCGHFNLSKKLINEHKLNTTGDEDWTALHFSARNGTSELFKLFADIRTDIYLNDNSGRNCLHIASLFGHLDLCKTFLDRHKFDVLMTDNCGWAALHCSARNDSYDLVTLFADMGTDIHLKDNLGRNCLNIAALFGHLNLCKTLIDKHNFDVHMADENGWTALHYSARNGSYELVIFFVNMGTDIHAKDNFGENSLHITADCGNLALSKILVDEHNFDVLMTDNDGCTALHHPARNGSYELITFFVDMETDINLEDKLGRNCLHIAALYGHLNLCKTLVDIHNFDVHLADNNGCTALHYSASSGSFELLTWLIGIGSNIDLKDNFGQNILHFAALSGHLNLCRTLLDKHKFNVDMADNGGCTALHFSTENGNYELITYFVNMESDIHLKDNSGRNCLHIAVLHGHLNLCKNLIDEDNFDVHMADYVGWRVLHYSTRNGSYELFTFFADKGSNVHIKIKNGTNSLHIASLYGHLNLCKTFIEKYNFDVHEANNGDWRALHFSGKNGSFNLFSYILGKGSEIYCKTKSTENVSYLAAREGHFDVCKFVLEYFIKDYNDNNTIKQHNLNGTVAKYFINTKQFSCTLWMSMEIGIYI